MNDIVILGATGKTGRRVVELLRAEGRRVRPASRSSEVRFDWFDRATWEGVLSGADAVYLVPPEDPAAVRDFVKRAERVKRFVVLSGRGLEHAGDTYWQGMRAAEEAVGASGAEWTILRANNFNQNFSEDLWHAPLLEGRLALPVGAALEPFVDVHDIAAVAARALTADGRHGGQVYELSGPRGLTFGEAVRIMGQASGRTIEYVELTPEEYRTGLLAEGLPEEVADELGDLFAVIRAGHVAEPADGVQRVLGRPPISFEEYAARAWAVSRP
ncbi:NAD(P)H-binding protein [Nonomuraea sp. NPDC050786]|uniref:NmrA family NAD(P)-binding protein n=1 Tax=Nonomuraea sp. NPDC050786 TaxID=3154840 RepID=UPI003407FCBC